MTARAIARATRHDRGFTMVELLVALTAGLMVAVATGVLAKNATALFQHEARIAAAQLGAQLGLNRLTTDLQLAGHMSPANVRTNRFRCPEVQEGIPTDWPASLQNLASVTLTEGDPSTAPAQSAANGFAPDTLDLTGNYHTTEQFSVQMIQDGAGGGRTVFLWPNSPEMSRTLTNAGASAAGRKSTSNTLDEIFKPGRFLRIVDRDVVPHQEFGIIAGLNTNGGQIAVQLAATPPPRKKPDDDPTCGYTGFGTGTVANPIAHIRYQIQSLAGGAHAALVSQVNPAVTGDAGRTELVRYELDDQGNEMAGSFEVIAEYAVDLKFGLTTSDLAAVPSLLRHPIVKPDDPTIYTISGPLNVAGSAPEQIVAMQVRLSTRTRAPDRDVDLGVAADGRRQRFLIPNVPRPQYARMRTLYAEVQLRNVMNQQQ